MYFPPLRDYLEFGLGFILGWVLTDRARYAYWWVKRKLKDSNKG